MVFLFCLLVFPASAALAQGTTELRHRDGINYLMDDGIMSQEEMEQEANDMYRLCTLNPYLKTYADCGCIAGAFLIEREKLGPYVPQSTIYERIRDNGRVKCANTESVAITTYNQCMEFSQTYYEMARDHVEYCTCVGNDVAREYERRPVINSAYISALTTRSMTSCRDPNYPARQRADAGARGNTPAPGTSAPQAAAGTSAPYNRLN
ncbi:MAG: hypothetical protein WC989_08900 [Micavibrio sp.]